MKAYPLKFRPVFKERIWGGSRLRELFGKPLPQTTKIGESWELSDLPGSESIIMEGDLAGMSIGEAARRYPQEIMGIGKFSGQFPLLLKLLDAQDVLSVQVHPDNETCKRQGKGQPKTECWYIIEARSGACIYKGLRPGVTRVELEAAISGGMAAELLRRVEVASGECHFLPAGTPHAIGAGLVIAEVQTPSDTTYRLFDWGRVDGSGQSRQLHVADALDSIHFGQNNLGATTIGRLVDSDYFKVDKGHQAAGTELLFSDKMKVLMFVRGGGRIVGEGVMVEFGAGETILIPAAFVGAAVFGMETEYLTITL